MTQAIARKTQYIMSHREAVFGLLLACLVLSIFWYAYSVHKAVTNVVARESIMNEIQHKGTDVADLESKYFALKNSVSLDLAHRKGFKDVPISFFISKKSQSQTLTLSR